MVQDEKSAYEIQKATSHIQHVPAKIICESNQSANGLGKHIIAGWSFLPDLLRSLPSTQSIFPIEGIDSGEKPSLLILTSGTTSEPKVCPHTAANLWSQTTMFSHALQLTSSHSLCFNMPNFHLAGILHVLGMWRAGGTVVIPSASFDAEATLDAIERFQVTHMSCVPTIIRALVNHVSFDPSRTKSLRYLHLTATTITPDIMKLAQERLRLEAVYPGWGMSEGGQAINWSLGDEVREDQQILGVGRVMPGVRIRVCDPPS